MRHKPTKRVISLSGDDIDTGEAQNVIRADGGLIANQFVCQFLADILQTPIDVPAVTEATAFMGG